MLSTVALLAHSTGSLVRSVNVLVKGKRLGNRRGVFKFVPFGTSGHCAEATCPSGSGTFEFVLTGEEFEWGNVFDNASVLSLAQAEYDAVTSSKSGHVWPVHRLKSDTSATRTQRQAPATIDHVCSTDERDSGCMVIRGEFLRDWGVSEIPVSPWIVQTCQRTHVLGQRRGASSCGVSNSAD